MKLSPAQLKGKIKSIANKTNTDAIMLMRIYMMERFLERLSCSRYKDNFIIKGGILVTSMVGIWARTTMDIDASVRCLSVNKEEIIKAINEIANIDIDDNVLFEMKRVNTIMDNFEYPGIRIDINASMGKMVIPIKIDISTDDVITPKEINYEYSLILEDKKIDLWAYNLETILAEKLETILSRDVFNTRMRDFYDIYVLINTYGLKLDKEVFKKAFQETLKKRNSKFNNIDEQIQNIVSNQSILNLWNQYRRKYSYASNIELNDVIISLNALIKAL